MRLSKLRKLGRPIVPSDLRNPARISGYDYVGKNGTGPSPYQCDVYGGKRDLAGRQFKGPRRRYAELAAADFCDYVNGAGVSMPATLATAGHEYTIDETDKDPEYQAALGVMRDRKAQRTGAQDYLYMMIETEYAPGRSTGGALTVCKVGHSTNPRKRLAEVQAHNPRRLALLYVKPLPAGEDDRPTHRRHIKANILHEWFYPTKALLFEFKASDRHTDDRAYTAREKALAKERKAA